MIQVAVLFVAPRGRSPYWEIPGTDCWDVARDATLYRGGMPVVAHPPCQLWGRLWWSAARARGFPEGTGRGEDGGLAMFAVDTVRRCGGVLEHPIGSSLWAAAGVSQDPAVVDGFGGRFLRIEQGWYGHVAPKATGLYCVRTAPLIVPTPPRRVATGRIELLSSRDPRRHATPDVLAAVLVHAARSAKGAP